MMLDVDWTVFETFAISVAFLVIKVLAMGPLTARQRFKHKVKVLHALPSKVEVTLNYRQPHWVCLDS